MKIHHPINTYFVITVPSAKVKVQVSVVNVISPVALE